MPTKCCPRCTSMLVPSALSLGFLHSVVWCGQAQSHLKWRVVKRKWELCVMRSESAVGLLLELLRVLFFWINFSVLPGPKSLGLFSLEFWFPSWRLFSEPAAVQAPAQWEQLATWVVLLYLDILLVFLILTCRFTGRAANNFLPWSFSWLSPLSFCVSFFLCGWH